MWDIYGISMGYLIIYYLSTANLQQVGGGEVKEMAHKPGLQIFFVF